MSRGVLLTVLYRLDGANVASDRDKWYSDALVWSKEAGLSGGTAPEDAVSREQLAVILYRYVGAPKTEDMALKEFNDADSVSNWAADAMRWAVQVGLIQGSAGRLNPTGTATRIEVAAILQRFVANAL